MQHFKNGVEMADLFRDDVSMLIRELLLAHLLPGKVFNLVALWTEKKNKTKNMHAIK